MINLPAVVVAAVVALQGQAGHHPLQEQLAAEEAAAV
jgi:hypothetical protein